MELKDLDVYNLACDISRDSWGIYEKFDWNLKKILGDQFIRAIDSIGANIAEGFGRFHYLDKNKFNYNARGSLFESKHWVNTLIEREKIDRELGKKILENLDKLAIKLNNYINVTRRQNSI
jgi:four helix bundle protein